MDFYVAGNNRGRESQAGFEFWFPRRPRLWLLLSNPKPGKSFLITRLFSSFGAVNMGKLWVLTRLCALGFFHEEFSDFLHPEVQNVLSHILPVWQMTAETHKQTVHNKHVKCTFAHLSTDLTPTDTFNKLKMMWHFQQKSNNTYT